MTNKMGGKFFLVMNGLAILGIVLFFLVLSFVNPYGGATVLPEASSVGKVSLLSLLFFYGSLLTLFTGLFSSLFFWIKLRGNNTDNIYLQAVTSFRRGVLLSVLICLLLMMQSLRIFIWWDALLVAGMIILLEMYLMVR